MSSAEASHQEAHIDDDRRADIILATVICWTAACIAVALRFTARRMVKAGLQLDDWLILMGLVSFPGDTRFFPVFQLLRGLTRIVYSFSLSFAE